MSWFSSMFHPGDAYKKAGQKEQQGYDAAQGMRNPYIQQGQEAGGDLMSMFKKLMNPGELQNEWSAGYQESPYAKQLQEQAQTGGLDAASAMGLGGSSAALSNIQHGSADIMNADRKSYMDDMMQKYMSAMGLGNSMYGTGANMAGQGANAAGQHGEWQGQNTYNQNAAGGNMMNGIFSGLAGLGGAALGGPIGGALGSWLGNKLGAPQNSKGGYG